MSSRRSKSLKSKSPKKSVVSKYKSKSPKRSPKRSSAGSYKYKSPSMSMEKVKFYDLIAKKPFYTTDYKVKTRTTHSQNGKRLITYYVTMNPTPKKDGNTFENWKIVSNEKA